MPKWKNPNQGLFNGYWFDLSGSRIRKLRRNEYPELYRLWREHRDIREGTHPMVYQGVKLLGSRSVLHG